MDVSNLIRSKPPAQMSWVRAGLNLPNGQFECWLAKMESYSHWPRPENHRQGDGEGCRQDYPPPSPSSCFFAPVERCTLAIGPHSHNAPDEIKNQDCNSRQPDRDYQTRAESHRGTQPSRRAGRVEIECDGNGKHLCLPSWRGDWLKRPSWLRWPVPVGIGIIGNERPPAFRAYRFRQPAQRVFACQTSSSLRYFDSRFVHCSILAHPNTASRQMARMTAYRTSRNSITFRVCALSPETESVADR